MVFEDKSPVNENNPFVDSREDFDEPEAGWIRQRILPDRSSPPLPRSRDTMAGDSYDGHFCSEFITRGEATILNQAITDPMCPIKELNEYYEKTWEEALKDLVLNKLFNEEDYKNHVRYFHHLFEESCRLLPYCPRPQDTRMLIPSADYHIQAYLVPCTLRILHALGYETESVDRVEAMDHVTLFVNGRMQLLRMSKMCELMRCMARLTLVEARSMLLMTSSQAGIIIELLQSAESGHVEEHYQPTLKLVWDSGNFDLLQSVGFSQRKTMTGKKFYKYTSLEKCRRRAAVVFTVLQTFHKPANTLV